jgi:hypothetical protein
LWSGVILAERDAPDTLQLSSGTALELRDFTVVG